MSGTGAELLSRDCPDFNEALMVFLPKEGINIGEGKGMGCAPEATRPLSIANGECRILANAARYAVERCVSPWVSESQQGFLPGRSMLSNVLAVDERMMEVALKEEAGSAVFLDFRAAFPTVSRGFILTVLRRIGVPASMMALVTTLYHANSCWVVAGGKGTQGSRWTAAFDKDVRSHRYSSPWLLTFCFGVSTAAYRRS